MVEPLRHRQTKGAATDMLYLTPPRHISTLPKSEVWVHNLEVRFAFSNGLGRPDLSGQLSAMYGRRPRCKRNLTFQRSVRVQPCIRPLNAAAMAAGPDVIR